MKFARYFLVAACEARCQADSSTLPWFDYGGTRRHFIYDAGHPVKSTGAFPGLPLQLNGVEIRRYPYFVSLRVSTPWHVPKLQGTLPTPPTKDATLQQKGLYALFVQMLFRPWRGDGLPDFIMDVLSSKSLPLTNDQIWEAGCRVR